MTSNDLALVLSWRNHPRVRQYMFTQHEISPDEHRSWFERAQREAGRQLLVFESAGRALGYVSFSELHAGRVADWGFHISPEAPKGTGTALGHAALEHAFRTEQFHKVCGRVLQSNIRSARLHLRLGFVEEGRLRDQHFDGEKYHCVTCFGILREEWCNAMAGDHRGE
jgi:UDP-4-amino-4,6-dideoxy-N-acetyl-beta-L-altrosamine N-acetyltransferase